MSQNMKHTEVPHELDNLKEGHTIEHGDKVIYASIRRYMNAKTRECFPAVGTIASALKCSTKKVQHAIERLVNAGFINKCNDGHKNHYYFPESEFDKRFEMFTDEFSDMDLPLNVKEYYMDIQQYLYGKDTGVGKCALSNAELARRTGWTTISSKKYNTILIEKNLLEEEETTQKDEAGFPVIQKRFDLQGFNQAVLWVKQVNEAIIDHEDRIAALERKLGVQSEQDDIYKELEELRAFKARTLREKALENNSTDVPYFKI